MAILVCGAALVLAGCVATTPEGPTSTPPSGARQWVMPNLVGSKLQDAQDQIQKLTGIRTFITFSHDATGQGRNQVLDSNWKVCSQNIAPGTAFDDRAKIDFGAVKLSERCP